MSRDRSHAYIIINDLKKKKSEKTKVLRQKLERKNVVCSFLAMIAILQL